MKNRFQPNSNNKRRGGGGFTKKKGPTTKEGTEEKQRRQPKTIRGGGRGFTQNAKRQKPGDRKKAASAKNNTGGGAEEASQTLPNAKHREIGKKRRQPKTQTWGGERLHTKKKGPNAKEGKYEKNEASANKTTKEGAGTTASSFRCGPSRLLP